MNNKLGFTLMAGTFAIAMLVACGDNKSPALVKATKLTPNGMITYMKPVHGEDVIEKIIGTNELTSVVQDGANIPQKFRPLIDAFGMLSMGCTATYIGNGLALSAGHCFGAPEVRKNNVSCSETIKWGFRKDKDAYLESKCVLILAYEQNSERDYAIFKVDKLPPVSVEVDLSKRPEYKTKITIFGFPQMRPMEWSQYCVVEPSSNGSYGSDEFSHQCDTEGGNSGSTILDEASLKVVGIHDGGLVPWNYGTFLVNTPLKEFVGGDTTLPPPVPTVKPTEPPTPPASEPDRVFGPFTNNKNIVLTTLEKVKGKSVTFQIKYDVEKNYDYVIIRDGDGKTRTYTGKGTKTIPSLTTPVSIRIKTDEMVESNTIIVSKIVFSK